MPKIVFLNFTLEGQAFVERIIPNFSNQLKQLLYLDDYKEKIVNQTPMKDEKKKQLELELK